MTRSVTILPAVLTDERPGPWWWPRVGSQEYVSCSEREAYFRVFLLGSICYLIRRLLPLC